MNNPNPSLIIFCGLQASGKTSFYVKNFLRTHVHISLDLLRTRKREERFFNLCLETRFSMVIDNTNPSRDDRAKYLTRGRAEGFRILGYYFQSHLSECLDRNAQRNGSARIPDAGLRSCARRLEIPTVTEGFDQLTYVRLQPGCGFITEEWNNGL
jgi:predicted kinase